MYCGACQFEKWEIYFLFVFGPKYPMRSGCFLDGFYWFLHIFGAFFFILHLRSIFIGKWLAHFSGLPYVFLFWRGGFFSIGEFVSCAICSSWVIRSHIFVPHLVILVMSFFDLPCSSSWSEMIWLRSCCICGSPFVCFRSDGLHVRVNAMWSMYLFEFSSKLCSMSGGRVIFGVPVVSFWRWCAILHEAADVIISSSILD